MFENGRRERKSVNYLNGTNVSLFEKETKVWKLYGVVAPNLVKQTRPPSDVREQRFMKNNLMLYCRARWNQ